jgi:threonylcarbamoyladenosine tRNA methylthiotransferase MtaB
LARGASRNLPIAEAVRSAREIAASGCREIVLTGINTGDYGRTTGEGFIDLLKALEAVDGIERYRISSIEPNLLTDEIVEFTARSGRFMPHFHIPLQSGSDRVLKMMRRRYTTSVFAARVEAVRRAMPDAFIGIDVIVGFPGETRRDFELTYDFLNGLRPSFLHVFPYSVRGGTPAAEFPDKVPPEISKERIGRLLELSAKLHRDFAGQYVGAEMEVLFESTVRGGRMSGFTPNYLRVEAPYDRASVGYTTPVRITGFTEKGDLEAFDK